MSFGSHGERGEKIQLGHVALSPPVLPCWPVACPTTTPSAPTTPLGKEKGKKKKKERQTRPGSWDQSTIRAWLPPVPDEGNGDGDWVGQSMDDSCRFGTAGLGSLDGSSTEKERREEKEKKRKGRASSGRMLYRRDTAEIKSGTLPCLCPFPLFSTSNIPVRL